MKIKKVHIAGNTYICPYCKKKVSVEKDSWDKWPLMCPSVRVKYVACADIHYVYEKNNIDINSSLLMSKKIYEVAFETPLSKLVKRLNDSKK